MGRLGDIVGHCKACGAQNVREAFVRRDVAFFDGIRKPIAIHTAMRVRFRGDKPRPCNGAVVPREGRKPKPQFSIDAWRNP